MAAYDYVVVGGGAAGCTLAGRLSDGGYRVLLLEAGPVDDAFMIRMPAGFFSVYANPKFNWGYNTEPGDGLQNRSIFLPRGKVLGGSASLNAMVFLRGHPKDYDGWAQDGLPDWRFQRCLPFFKRLETSDRGPTRYRGGSGPVHVQKGSLNCRIFDGFLSAAVDAGHPLSDDLNGAQPEGVARLDSNRKNGRRWTAADAYVRPALLNHDRLTVQTGALAKKIVVERGVAVGVQYELQGRSLEVRPEREVIVCGGAYNSPHLLMLSGIGPADHLSRHGIAVQADLPGVGSNLHDHLQIVHQYTTKNQASMAWIGSPSGRVQAGSRWLANRTGPLASNLWEAGGFIRSSPDVAYPDLQYHVLPLVIDDTSGALRLRDGFLLSITSLRPHSRGAVRLRSADPRDKPLLNLGYLTDDRDLEPFVQSIDHTREIVAQRALAEMISSEFTSWGALKTRDERVAEIRRSANTIHHPVGTCRMGVDDLAVVDARFRVRGVENLRVVDASIMPSVISANTNCATMMIAERAASELLEEGINVIEAAPRERERELALV